MKMYEAMLKGAKMKKQCFGKMYQALSSCALGAAFDGVGINPHTTLKSTAEIFPSVANKKAYCPAGKCGGYFFVVGEIIPHLNDTHEWTREAIAEWLKNEVEIPAEITERKNGHPPMVPAAEVMAGIEVVEEALVPK